MKKKASLANLPWTEQQKTLEQILVPLATLAAAFVVFLAIRRAVLRLLGRHAQKEGNFASVALDTVRTPSLFWCLAASIGVALVFSEVPPAFVRWANGSIVAFVVISLSLVAASVAIRMAVIYGQRKHLPVAESGLWRTLIRVSFLAIGMAILFAYYDYRITPFLTALGVGGLALALALQDTLANFFAGVHILVEEPVAVGQIIRLSSGEEGIVTDIGWRTTRVRTLQNNMVVIPNTKITSGILTNFSMPTKRMAVLVDLLASQDADIDLIQRIALEEAAATPGVLSDPPPAFALHPGMLPTHLQALLIVHVEDFLKQGPVRSEIRLRLLRRFRAEHIPPPHVPPAALAPGA